MKRVLLLPLALVAALVAVVGSIVVAAPSRAASHGTVRTGVVVIETDLSYQQSAAAGTGMVLTPNGVVLTNNHVIRGATTVRVVVPGGRTYTGRVLGYDVSADVAVVQLKGASGLATVSLGTATSLHAGDRVTAVGNAGGTGRIVTASGKVLALRRTITASDGDGTSEQLTGLIATNAPLQPGDSGGPLLDSARRVVGMNTAASVGWSFRATGTGTGFAIPIDRALAIERQIVAGRSSATVHVGATAFLGIAAQAGGYGPRWDGGSSSGGVVVGDVVSGSPAERAGLVPGSVITALAGRAVDSPNAVVAALQPRKPGDRVRVEWIDPYGNSQSSTVALASGPPQ